MKRIMILSLLTVLSLLACPGSTLAQEAACMPDASFIADVTVPDDTVFKPGEVFEKVWRLENSGTCLWDDTYVLSFVDGDPLGAWASLAPGETVHAGESVDLGIKMQAPASAGTHTGWWQIRDAAGQFFGDRVYVRILVKGTDEVTSAPLPAKAAAEPALSSTPVSESAPAMTTEATATPTVASSRPRATAGKIAFTVLNTEYQPEPVYELYVVNADGTGRQLIAQGMRQPHLRADAMILAKGEGLPGQDTLYAVAGDTSRLWQISPFGTDERPSWAPDGDTFVFSNRQDGAIIIQDTLQRDAPRLPLRYDLSVLEGKQAGWLPDGRIIYNGCNVWASSGSCGLYVADRSGGLPMSLTTDPSDLSPDAYEHRIVFMSHRDGNWEIYRMHIDGGNPTRLTDNPANDGLPTWSPFGHKIAFLSDRGGEWAVWTMEIDGRKPQKLFALNGPMGEDWIEERISWDAWPQDVAVPPTPTPAPVKFVPTPISRLKTGPFSDDFSDPRSGLPDNPGQECEACYQGDQYQLRFDVDQCGRNYTTATYDSDYKYFTAQVSLGRFEGEGEFLGSGEFIFGYQDDANYYAAAFSRWGRSYRIYRIHEGIWKDLKPWTEGGSLGDIRGSAEARPVWDRMKVIVRGLPEGGAGIELYGDGSLFTAEIDEYYDGGAVGFGVRAGGYGHVAVEDFQIEPLH